MLVPLRFWSFAVRLPSMFRGEDLHRAGLRAAADRRFALAEDLFEAAAGRYRLHLMVPALARLRVHQLMARTEACREHDLDAALECADETERRLLALEAIEEPEPPFREVRALDLLATWSARRPRDGAARAA